MRSRQSGCARGDRLATPGSAGRSPSAELSRPAATTTRLVERAGPPSSGGTRVRDALDARGAVAARRVVAPVVLGEHRERVEARGSAPDVAREPGRWAWKFMCSWPTVTAAAGASARGEQVEARARADHEPAAHAPAGAHAAQVGAQAAPRVGVVVGVHEQAREARAAARRRLRWSSTSVTSTPPGNGKNGCSRRRTTLTSSTTGRCPPAPRARFIVVRIVPPMPYACSSRMRTSRPSGLPPAG